MDDLYEHQNARSKRLIHKKTRTFTMDIFIQVEPMNVVVFPSLGLINQYCDDYILSLEEPFQCEFKKYK